MPRRANQILMERFGIPYSVPSTAASVTTKLAKAKRPFRVDRVSYVNPTGLVASDTNYYVIGVLKGATVLASWSTKLTGGNGSLAADTFVDFVNSATDADLVFAAADELKWAPVLTGAATLAAGQLWVEGRYL